MPVNHPVSFINDKNIPGSKLKGEVMAVMDTLLSKSILKFLRVIITVTITEEF